MSDTAPLSTFLATRFYPPRRDGEYVERDCTGKITEDVMAHRIVMLRAPAGYGKTTTASACYWHLSKKPGLTAWLNLTDLDGVSLIEFVRYLSQALGWSIGDLAPPSDYWQTKQLDLPSVQFLSRDLCNTATEYRKPVYLFLDDFDAIIGSEAEKFIHQVLREAPSNLHIITASRSLPSFGLGRLRMEGLLTQVGVEQLRFTEADAAKLLAASKALNVDEQLVSAAVEKTEGWAAGLQLVGILLAQSNDVQTLLRSFNGEALEVGEFLAEDVFASLDPKLMDFLLKTSVLKRFCVPLCNAITGRSDSREIIDELESRSLFIMSLDNEGKWYRYQSLFSDFLLRSLKSRYPEMLPSLHLAACKWYVDDAMVVQGVKHALMAEDFDLAASLLEDKARFLLGRGLLDTHQKLVSRIPEDVLVNYPNLRLWSANYLICYRRFREAQPVLKQVEQYLDDLREEDDTKPSELQSIATNVLRAKMMLAQFMDDMPTLERLCETALLETNPEWGDDLLGSLHASLLHAQREQYRLDQVEHHSSLARECFSRSGFPFPKIMMESIVGPSYAQRGEFETSEECYRRALDLCDVDTFDTDAMRECVSSLLAELHLERFQVDEAKSLFEKTTGEIQRIGFVDNLIAFYVGRSRLAAYEGDWEVADRLLKEGIDCAVAQSLERLRWSCVDERIRQYLRRKDSWGALRIASDSGLPASESKLYPTGEFTTTREAMAMAWARTALGAGRPKDALKLLKRWLSFVERQRAVRSHVKLSLLAAQVYQALGEMRSSLRSIKDVMPHIAKSGMFFCLIEEGEALRSVILQAYEIEGDVQSDLDFAGRLQQAVELDTPSKNAAVQVVADLSQTSHVQSEVLNAKEIEILRLVAQSKLNKEIASQLGLTEGTVKWYLQQIYDKFGVRRRFAALERARILGYL